MDNKISIIWIVILLSIALVFLRPITGNVASTSGNLKFVLTTPCSFALLTGWNLFSICANPINDSVENITAPIKGKYDYILYWNRSIQAYQLYSIYSQKNPFERFDINESYFIHMLEPEQNFYIIGTQRGDLVLPLIHLWNTPTYPYELKGNVTRYLETISGRYEYMMKWNASSQSWLLWSVYSQNKPFRYIFKGEGQFIFVNATDALLKYNRSYVTGG